MKKFSKNKVMSFKDKEGKEWAVEKYIY